MSKLLAVTLALAGSAGAASAQLFAPPQPMPAQVVPATGTMTSPFGTVVPAGAFTPAVTGGVVTGQPYYLNPSVMGGTVVGMPRVTGNPYPQPFTTYSTGNAVVGGSVMANGSIPYTTFSPTTMNGVVYPANMTTPQAMGYAVGNRMMAAPTAVGYQSAPYTGTVTPAGYSGMTVAQPRFVQQPTRAVRRLFRR